MSVDQEIAQARKAEIQAAGSTHPFRQAEAHVQQVAGTRQVEAGGEVHLDAGAVVAVVQHQVAQRACFQGTLERGVAVEAHRGGTQRGTDDGLDVRGDHETGAERSDIHTEVRAQIGQGGVPHDDIVAHHVGAAVGVQGIRQIGVPDGIDQPGGHLRGGILVDVDLEIAIHAREVQGVQRLGGGKGLAGHLHLQVRQLVHRRRAPKFGETVGVGAHQPRHEGGAGSPEAAAEGIGHHVADQQVETGAILDVGDLAIVLPHRQVGAADVLDARHLDRATGGGGELEAGGHLAGLATGVPVDIRPHVHLGDIGEPAIT